MAELADIFRSAGPAYRQAFERRMPPSHVRAMEDIVLCRTPALGGSVYACDDCGNLDYSYHSCRNRHCPKCQQDRARDWLAKLRARLLPCDHYLLTFTLPEPLRAVARAHQRAVYDILLREAAASAQTLAHDPKWLGGRPAILAVLHTWSRTLAYHPHAHLLVSAGGLAPDGAAWRKPAHGRFLVPGYALSQVFRAKMRDALSRADLAEDIHPNVWNAAWAVHVQQIGSGQHAALYLSRYVYRVALSNERIEAFARDSVTFRYTHARTRETRRMTLPAQDFIARFLQHVLPRGFCKIRYYGLLSPSAGKDLERARQLLLSEAASTNSHKAEESDHQRALPSAACPPAGVPPSRLCSACGTGHLRLQRSTHRQRAPP
ncbi:MAG TPA: IS91 family transposase [Thermoleophilia bacterium]|nr:IS91 family transposase [Thermoleophilia bacterium]